MQLNAVPARVVPKAEFFCHDQARAVSRRVLKRERARLVVIDLSRANDATTAAFAVLVLLRRELLRSGRDLRLAGLTGRTRQVYCINRLDAVLPEHAMEADVAHPGARPGPSAMAA